MASSDSFTIESLRERVRSVSDFLETKKLLNEVFLNYFVSQLYTESGDQHKADATFLVILLNDMFDEYFTDALEKKNQDPKGGELCNN